MIEIIKIANMFPRVALKELEKQGKEPTLINVFGSENSSTKHYYQYFQLTLCKTKEEVEELLPSRMESIYGKCVACQLDVMENTEPKKLNDKEFLFSHFKKCNECQEAPIITVPKNEKKKWCEFMEHVMLDLQYDFIGGGTLNPDGNTVIHIN